jgi:hypothetical protein
MHRGFFNYNKGVYIRINCKPFSAIKYISKHAAVELNQNRYHTESKFDGQMKRVALQEMYCQNQIIGL